MNWKTFSRPVICSFIFFLSSCGTSAIEKWNGKIYSYQVNDLAFERKQDNEVIPYNAAGANGMFCMNQADFMDFLKTYVVTPKLVSPKNQ